MLTRSLSYGVTAQLQSLDFLRDGSILTVVGVVRFLVFAHAEEKMRHETESGRAIYNCTARVSVAGLSTGQSNPWRLLC